MPNSSLQHLAQLSRDKRFLVRTSLSVVMMSVALSLGLSLLPRSSVRVFSHEHLVTLRSDIVNLKSTEDWVYWLRFGDAYPYHPDQLDFRNLQEFSDGSLTDEVEAALEEEPDLLAYFRGLTREDREDQISALKALPEEQRYRNEFLGDLYILNEDYEVAAQFYREEADRFPESSYAQRSAVITTLWNDDRETARQLLADPKIASRFHVHELTHLQADARAWSGLFVSTIKFELGRSFTLFAIPAAFTGLIWYLILTNFWRFDRTRFIASLLALACGILSAFLTLYAFMIQERSFGFVHNPSDTQIAQVIYFVSGVALREETLKLICFLPLAFWCARRKNDLEALILAGLVGLGFAMQENISYYSDRFVEQASLTRLLTANPLHFALTGLVGYYAYRMIVRKFYGWEEFLATFILAVLFHGAYNSVIVIAEWQEYSILTYILMALLVYRYFDPLRAQMDMQGQQQRLSPLGIFIMGTVAITCIVMMVSAPFVGFGNALAIFAQAVGSVLPLAFAYISRFRDL